MHVNPSNVIVISQLYKVANYRSWIGGAVVADPVLQLPVSALCNYFSYIFN